MNATITLREYLKKDKCFVVPNYQRGYVWGKNKSGEAKDSVSYMLDSLMNSKKHKSDVFIQGVTVSERNNEEEIVLIDGQQRTTFFYLLLKWLGYEGNFKIRYDIRDESNKFLNEELDNIADFKEIKETGEEKFQDIYFFKKTLRIIGERLELENEEKDVNEAKNDFCEYVLDHVKFLYIDIPENKATKVFTMMNGNKAEMKAEELIKAELLRLASLNEAENSEDEDKETYAIEWDNNMLRSRYAREWDKWLQWWNREDVKKLYKVDCVMGWLVSTYQQLTKTSQLSFESFKNKFLNKQEPIKAKQTFDGLRRLQKRFEDAFNNPKVYNMVGAIIRISNDKESFIKWYFLGETTKNKKSSKDEITQKYELYSLREMPSEDELIIYYKLAFLGLTHDKIISSDESDRQESIDKNFKDRYRELDSNNLYNSDYRETAFRLLLRLNIDEDNLQENRKGRKFDFSIWDDDIQERSLEHIYPKSKVYHKEIKEDGTEIIRDGNDKEVGKEVEEDKSYIARDSCKFKDNEEYEASEHSIGNLVLLYKDENSKFGDKSFKYKKGMFFRKPEKGGEEKELFKSRHLLHTIYTFATDKWDGEEIAKQKKKTLHDFAKYYNNILNEDGKE